MAPDLTLRRDTVATPLGPFTIVASPDGVVATTTADPATLDEELARRLGAGVRVAALRAATREVEAYFAGRRRTFVTPVDLRLASTPFAAAVLRVVRGIPYGELWTYGDVAGMAGRPKAARAAGTVLAHAPIELFVPCHRVVPAGPGYGSYGGAEDRRVWLLRHEGAV